MAEARIQVSVQTEDFDLGAEVAALRAGDAGVGAVASFVGTVRQWGEPGEGAHTLELEHYPGMTERSLASMARTGAERFGALGVRIIHRVGPLGLGDQIVLVAVSSPHRRAAFECCEFLMDWLKTRAPFWKKEISASGGAQWVDAREHDDEALARWGDLPVPGASAGAAR